MYDISIIIPAHNEELVISNTILRVIEYFNGLGVQFELLVVDDGSTDGTCETVSRKMVEFSTVNLIENKENRGKGFSVKQGVLAAKGEWILFLDADLSTDPEEFEKFKVYLNEYDILIGSRTTRGAKIMIRQPFFRELAGKLANKLIRLVLGLPYHDTQCGFKAFRRKTFAIFHEQKLNSWLFDAELLYLARKKNFKIKEIGIRWKNDPTTTVRKSDFLKLLNDLHRIRKLHH